MAKAKATRVTKKRKKVKIKYVSKCKNCGKREVEFTSYPVPLTLNNLTFKWKIGEYNADTVSNILCGIKDGE